MVRVKTSFMQAEQFQVGDKVELDPDFWEFHRKDAAIPDWLDYHSSSAHNPPLRLGQVYTVRTVQDYDARTHQQLLTLEGHRFKVKLDGFPSHPRWNGRFFRKVSQ